MKLKTNKATGIDNLAGKFLKDGSNTFRTTTAIIKLLYKKGLKTDPKNFRFISLLPLISKKL